MNDATDLTQLRQNIDDVDTQIHELLAKRVALVLEIARIKGSEGAGASPLRPEREVDILRRLARQHDSAFPLGSLFRIYREIMSASLQLQQRFCVSLWAGDNPVLSNLVRDFYGFSIPVVHESDACTVLERVSKDASVLGVLPLPDGSATGKWWLDLVRYRSGLLVVGCLPFLLNGGVGESRALVIGSMRFAPSGDDTSLLIWNLTAGMDIRDAEAFVSNNLYGHAWVLDGSNDEERRMLLAVRGHVTGTEELLAPLREFGGLAFLGGYANPWREDTVS